uniref:Uncharacterized protein n=1 Tax=Trichogramma kaykai TaxID=54128 RepID=A0ABD2XD86_9HYME
MRVDLLKVSNSRFEEFTSEQRIEPGAFFAPIKFRFRSPLFRNRCKLPLENRRPRGSPPSLDRAAAKRDDVAIWKLGKRVAAAAVYTQVRARQRRQRMYISEAGGDPLFSRLFSPFLAFVHGSPCAGVSTAKSHQCAIKHNKPQSRCHTPYTIPRN